MTYTKIQWGLIFITLVVEIVWIQLSSFVFLYNQNQIFFYGLCILVLYISYLFYKKFRPAPQIMSALLSFCWLLSNTAIMIILSYLAYSTNKPLITSNLAAIDQFLGIYPPAIVLWFSQHEGWNKLFKYIYAALTYQMLFTLFYFSFRKKFNVLQRFIMIYMISLYLTIFIGALFPAVGTYEWYHFTPDVSQVSELSHLYEVRQNILDIRSADGIIEFPSFHAALGLLYIFIFRHEKKIIFLPILVINSLMFFSCLSHVGQFFI